MKKIEHLTCDHCGLSFRHTPHRFETKHFCCVGCSTVYQLIENHQLQSYYTFNPQAGNIPPEQSIDYSYLDDDVFHSKFITFQDEATEHIKLYIPSIHCSACIWILDYFSWIGVGYSFHFTRHRTIELVRGSL